MWLFVEFFQTLARASHTGYIIAEPAGIEWLNFAWALLELQSVRKRKIYIDIYDSWPRFDQVLEVHSLLITFQKLLETRFWTVLDVNYQMMFDLTNLYEFLICLGLCMASSVVFSPGNTGQNPEKSSSIIPFVNQPIRS